jgi:DNA helicase-2/ATP-dependent DNA helicase PcrA
VFLPGWEEGVFPNQRALDDQGRAGLEEERRLAHVGLTRARRRAKIYFASNRRMRGLWQSNIPSRFLDELPEAHVEVTYSNSGFGGYGGNFGGSRFDERNHFGSSYTTPGWQRAQRNASRRGFDDSDDTGGDFDDARHDHAASPEPSQERYTEASLGGYGTSRRGPLVVDGELVAKSTGTVSLYGVGDRVFHVKFGNGNVTAVDGNKLTIQFDKAGEKRVVDSFVERAMNRSR